tara:strand:- start:404 stop:949 length:546 start_codon:yes stop_codon:yes gene_type:complete
MILDQYMSNETKQVIARIGETDQQYLENNTPELALERADLRLQLVMLSHVRQEQLHFLQEAIVLLEQARIEYDEMPLSLYLNLSLYLAKAYMIYFELTKEQRFALITQQILKPLAHHNHLDIYFFLAYASAAKQEQAMTRHWLQKYVSCFEYDLELLQVHPAFKSVRMEDWFKALIQNKAH